MYLEKRHIHKSTVLDCYGKFNDHDHDVFMHTLETLHAEGCRYVVVNLTSVLSDGLESMGSATAMPDFLSVPGIV